MSDIETRARVGERGAGAGLVDRLASYLKASAFYPANNRVVLDACDALLQEAVHFTQGGGAVHIQVLGRSILLNDEPVEGVGPLSQWLKDSFLNARIAGLEIRAGADAGHFAKFAELLRQNGRVAGPDAERNWSEAPRQVRPLELLFTSVDECANSDGLFASGSAQMVRTGLVGASARALEHLGNDEEIAQRLAEIDRLIRANAAADEESGGVDVLAEVTSLLPAEALRDLKVATSLMKEVLSVLVRTLERGVKDDDGLTLNLGGAAMQLAKRFFGVQVRDTLEPVPEDLPSGLPRDQGIHDDLDALLSEYEQLPRATGVGAEVRQEVFDDELFGVCLYQLCSAEDPVLNQGLENRLVEFFREPTEFRLRTLSIYLSERGGSNKEAMTVVAFLRRHHLTEILHQTEFLSPDAVIQAFPSRFDAFLEALDPDTEVAAMRLGHVLQSIPREIVLNALPELMQESAILTPHRVDVLLSVQGAEIAPFLDGIAEHGTPRLREKLAQYLKRERLPDAEAAALRCVEPASLLPTRYLRDLCHLALEGRRDRNLQEYSGFLVRKFITDTQQNASLLDRRLYAIHALRTLPSKETVEFLKRLRRSGMFLRQSRADRAQRQAAAKVLKYMIGEGD